ncbi:uncharacterized protein FOMMEDRAFT_18275 [Fomitiporia mediterranea MF3/22]|uniref:uncharacterized protein n=1 Tax=Fomitiporia mediterranea (strain MF3/22) TaxID=694068 RepID=UPI0004409642|nr:uncharacterized protein FOMMEDRAFT_18275 [Fomitiporia mediterranea MF3/22]EJD06072.1 hypothetical protein FOMMEDRAFT_18275 [Fomitiporia mediterranea MF3/22]
MGLRVAGIICITSFLLGILFVHWIADSLTLWKPSVTNENIWTAATYYSLFARAPSEMGYALATIVTLGAATILWSFGDGAAGNLMFDGASIFLYGTAISVYLYKIIPTFDGIFSTVPTSVHNGLTNVLKSEVLNFATANLVCSVSLTGVMALQAARWWAERADAEDSEEGVSRSPTQRRSPRRVKRRENTASRLTSKASRQSRHADVRS